MEKLYTIAEFSLMNKCGRSTVYRENKAGRLPFTKVGRSTRIKESDAVAWQEMLSVSERV